jgi:septal ring factor EnvC (AmiA/AmiB activator)
MGAAKAATRDLAVRVGLLFFMLAGSALAAFSDTEVDSKEGELQELRKRITRIQSDLGSAEEQRNGLLQELQKTEEEIGQSARRLRVLEGSLQRQRQRLEELEIQRRVELDKLAGHQQALAEQIRAAYAMGRQERIKILLNQQDPAVVSRVMVYYDYFNRTRAARMAEIGRALDELKQTEASIASEELRLRELQAKELGERDRLEQNRSLRQEVVAALGKDISSKGQELKGLEQNAEQLQGLVMRLQEALVNLPAETDQQKPFKDKRGQLPWPTVGRLTALFGTNKIGSLKWDGVIISAQEGQEVRAIDHGRVAFADWLRGFGLLIIIDHGDGYMTLYGHNQSLFKETGEWVEAGESVALVGSSGGQMNAGVYFGIRYNGQPVNPRKWCRAANRNKVGQIDHHEFGLSVRWPLAHKENRV